MPKKINERVIVDCISEFFLDNIEKNKALSKTSPAEVEATMKNLITRFVESKNFTREDADILERALWIQHYAGVHARTRGGTGNYSSSDVGFGYIFLPYPYYGWGGCCGYHHHHHGGGWGSSGSGSGSNMDGKGLLILLAIVLCGCAIASAVGMVMDLIEMGAELSHKQRMASNLATLALTAAYIVGTVLICLPLFAVNPLIGVIVAASLVIGMALLVKGVRAVANLIEGSLDAKSGVLSDSRFQLTEREETHLREQLELHGSVKIDDQIDGIKGIIRSLSLQARQTDEIRFFGSNSEYLDIVDVLNKVKKGHLTPQMKNQYSLTDFPKLGPDPKPKSGSDSDAEGQVDLAKP